MVAWFFLMAGCRNPCQKLCLDIRDYAEDECGITVPEEQVKTCLKTQRQVEREQARSCQDVLPSLQDEWECDDIEVYFQSQSGGTSDTAQ
jgi:hypothetical protein